MKSTEHFTLTKLDAAERHLHFAIKEFFGGGDIVPIHTLAYAAFQVTADLLAAQSKDGFVSRIKSQVIESAHRKVVDAVNAPGNFLKHADRDPNSQLEFRPLLTQSILFFAVDQFRELRHVKDAILEAYRIWFLWTNPSWLRNTEQLADLEAICRPFDGRWDAYLETVVPQLTVNYTNNLQL